LRAEAKPIQEGGNRRQWGSNRLHSTGNRSGHDGGSVAEEIGDGGVKTGRIRSGIGRTHDDGSAAQEIDDGGVKTGRIRLVINWLIRKIGM
jgi:hypothetical protein